MTDHTSPQNEENQCRFGIDSFAAAMPNRVTRITVTNVERIQNLLEKIEAVDLVGLRIFCLGEHPPSEYLDSAPLSSSPPVRRAPLSATEALIVGGPALVAKKIRQS